MSRQELLALLTERSYSNQEVTLASGRTSNFYIDCRQTSLAGRGHLLIGQQLLAAIEAEEERCGQAFDAVAGMTLGGDPLVSAVSLTAALKGREFPALIVRKEAKDHGAGRQVEGDLKLPGGLRLAVLEDVITTGGSTIIALNALRSAGHQPTSVFILVDRNEGGRANVEAHDVAVHSLFTRNDFPS
jgi:orotate phosphoribosyltransferase